MLIDIGLEYGDDSQNRFVLSENDHLEEHHQANCIIRIPKDMKMYQLVVDKNETVSQMYKRVLELCQTDASNIGSLILTFNSYTIEASEVVKVCKID